MQPSLLSKVAPLWRATRAVRAMSARTGWRSQKRRCPQITDAPMASALPLPESSSPSLLGFLNHHFKSHEDLSRTRSLAAQLMSQCHDLERDLLNLTGKLSAASAQWTARSDDVESILSVIDPRPDESRGGNMDLGLQRRILAEELPLLAKEVGRIETVRCYAETTLQLEVLVGDLEDATLSIISQASINNPSPSFSKASKPEDTGWKQENLLVAIKAMKDIEKLLASIASSRPKWTRLLMAVDFRVEKTLAILRPQALSDHRALLASLGWPPPLSLAKPENGVHVEIPNPLVLMRDNNKEKYSQSFLALCALQHFQEQCKARQKRHTTSNSSDVDNLSCFDHGLWTIDELAHPMASRMELHFPRWSDQPKFIFALVYKITRDFLNGVDDVLQPLIDRARLAGYSAKEAWVSAMVKMLSEYLARKEIPALVRSYDGRDGNAEAISSWLHLIDLMITFDKRMRDLASSGFERFLPSLSIMSIFNEHLDWLQIWADIELKEAMEKLSSDLDIERSWTIDIRQRAEFSYPREADSFVLSTREDYKAPLITDSVVRISWAMIERALALPDKKMRVRFIKSSASLFLKYFFGILLQQCKELDFAAYVLEGRVVLKAVGSVNAAQYCESVLREWSENISFLEMSIEHSHNSFFEEEIMYLVKLETDFLVETMSGLLLHFEALCWDYIQNMSQWEGEQILEEGNLSISPELVESLDMLRDRIGILKLNLNPKDFLDLWRSVAGGLDHFIFSSIPLSDARFSRAGVDQFRVDMRALFLVFRPFCARPEAFFPCTIDALYLLTMSCEDSDRLLRVLSKCDEKLEECLRFHGLFNVSGAQAEKILRMMEFGS